MPPVSANKRRVLCLWFPRLAVERLMRRAGLPPEMPIAVLRETGQMQIIHALSPGAEVAGLRLGQPYRDAMAMCAELRTRLANMPEEARFLQVLTRWAGKFSPWLRTEGDAGILLDISGCAHLFGGEEGLANQIEVEVAQMGISVRIGLADTVGAAWALARYAGQDAGSMRTGDAIDQEARATRSRAVKRRHWERGGAAPATALAQVCQARIAPPGQAAEAISPLPLAALRLPPETVQALARVGMRRVRDLLGTPRAPLARRFGVEVVQRLDQAMGVEPEPVRPMAPETQFAVRLTMPEPIGLEDDVLAAIDRLLPPLCAKLEEVGRGARVLRLQALRCDDTSQTLEVGLARPSFEPDRIRPLLAMKLSDLDAGFGIDILRIEVRVHEPVQQRQQRGHLEANARARAIQLKARPDLDDLIGRLGARLGLEALTRVHPGDSHIPEKGAQTLAAAWSDPAEPWPRKARPRPMVLFTPETVRAPEVPQVPQTFRWRGRQLTCVAASGPERISPEWWLDDPNWRTGVRDYWRVDAESGERLWLFFAHGAGKSPGWFCQGTFG